MFARYSIRSPSVVPRNSLSPLLSNIDTNAATVFNSNSNSNCNSVRRSRNSITILNGIKIVTDIDDTIKSSGGLRLLGIPLGGIDTQYKRGDVYPGVFQFIYELSIGKLKRNEIPNKVSVLTARAKEFKFALALKPSDKICSGFTQTGIKNGMKNWGIGDVYYGSVAEWIFQSRKGQRKLSNFNIMVKNDDSITEKETFSNSNRSKNNKCDYIFVGDTGELDEEAGERIAKQFPNRLKAIFLHSVSSVKDRDVFTIPKDRYIPDTKIPVFYFKTYVGAAAKAYNCGMINSDGLSRIIAQSKIDIEHVKKGNSNKAIIPTQYKELEEDIQYAMMVKKRSKSPLASSEDLAFSLDLLSNRK